MDLSTIGRKANKIKSESEDAHVKALASLIAELAKAGQDLDAKVQRALNEARAKKG